MKQIRKRLTYANVMSSIAIFLLLGGGAAFAAKKIGSNEIKANAITTGKIKKNAVTAAKIKKNAVTSAKIKDGAVTGTKVNVGTLATVPSANIANSLSGLTRFNVKLGFGQSQDIVKAGVFTLTAKCIQNGTDDEAEPNQDIARIVISTNADGKVFDAWDAKRGDEPNEFLNTTTPEDERIFVEESVDTGLATYEAGGNEDGAAYDPNGANLSVEQGGLGIGINVYGPGCFFHGYALAT